MRVLSLWVALGVVVSMACADRLSPPGRVDELSFLQRDSDVNGVVSRPEVRGVVVLGRVFNAADANKDGLLDPREFALARPAREDRRAVSGAKEEPAP